ncbi:MAG: hypothetical protein V2A34_02580 [Lentisphaerota bacterium]
MIAAIERANVQHGLEIMSADDSVEYASLPLPVQREAEAWMDALYDAIHGPRRGRGKALAHAAQIMRVSSDTARRKYTRYRQMGWRGLVNWAKAGGPDAGIPVETIRWIKGHAENFGGNFRRAYDAVIAWWKAGNDIPGYAEWPKPTAKGHPLGWSYENMILVAGLSTVEKRLARVGRASAKSCMPLIITTRVGLEPGRIYVWDDVWHDLLASMLGLNKETVRALELCCMDVFSACKIAYGIKPRIRDEVTGKRINLRDTDMRFFAAYVFTQIGYHEDGCINSVEHGTAAFSDELEKLLFDKSQGKITFNRSGIEDAPAILGGWHGKKHGNFRLKALLESSHNLSHNYLRFLPGQTGSNGRVDAPEELAGRQSAYGQLVRAFDEAIDGQPVERIQWLLESLQTPFIPFYLYARMVDFVYKIIDTRKHHDLEGWEEAGLVSGQFRLAPTDTNWIDDSTLRNVDPDKRKAIEAIVQANAGFHNWRRMSPREVWNQRQLKRLGDHLIPAICGEQLAVERSVTKRGTFEIDDKDVSPSTMVFVARAVDSYGRDIMLRDNETYATYLNPFDSNKLFICDASLRYVGVCTRQVVVSRADTEALVRSMGEASHNEAVRLQDYRMRHAPDAEDAEAMLKHNAAAIKRITSGKAVTKSEKAKASALKQFEAPDLLSGDERNDQDFAEKGNISASILL